MGATLPRPKGPAHATAHSTRCGGCCCLYVPPLLRQCATIRGYHPSPCAGKWSHTTTARKACAFRLDQLSSCAEPPWLRPGAVTHPLPRGLAPRVPGAVSDGLVKVFSFKSEDLRLLTNSPADLAKCHHSLDHDLQMGSTHVWAGPASSQNVPSGAWASTSEWLRLIRRRHAGWALIASRDSPAAHILQCQPSREGVNLRHLSLDQRVYKSAIAARAAAALPRWPPAT